MTDRNDDPIPGSIDYDELQELEPSPQEMVDGTDRAHDWYNAAVPVAANIIATVALEHEEYRDRLTDGEHEHGVGHEIKNFDMDAYERLNDIGLSSSQGGAAEQMARNALMEDDE